MSLKTPFHVLISMLALSTPLWAQPPSQTSPARLPLDQMLKLDVMLEPSADARQDAAQKGERPAPGKGSVKNFVISTRGGQVTWTALSVGGLIGVGDRVVLVPASSLEFKVEDGTPRYRLKMTEAQLKALPQFDPDKAEKDGLDEAIERAKNASGAPVSASARTEEKTGTGPGNTTEAPRFVLATRLLDAPVHAMDVEFGDVENATLNVRKNAIDYLIVSHGGALGVGDKTYVVPYAACAWTRVDDKSAIKIAKTAGNLETAPEYKKSEGAFLTKEQLEAANRFYGLPIESLVD